MLLATNERRDRRIYSRGVWCITHSSPVILANYCNNHLITYFVIDVGCMCSRPLSVLGRGTAREMDWLHFHIVQRRRIPGSECMMPVASTLGNGGDYP